MQFESKVIVSKKSALISKYGQNNFNSLNSYLETSYADNDRNRGVNTKVVYFDDSTSMQGIGTPYTGSPSDSDYQEKVKDVIDKIYDKEVPDYLCILGAPDIVPHIDLTNPAYGGGDPDPIVPSDLPYASSADYSQNVDVYLSKIDRSVGRITGRNGVGGDDGFMHLFRFLMTLAAHNPKDKSEYTDRYFSITMEQTNRPNVYQSINQSLYGSNQVYTSPHTAPSNITQTMLAPLSHDLTLHGSSDNNSWYGQMGGSYPVAMNPATIDGKISVGTVVAANPCYGAQLYNPGGMVNTYLESHTLAFMGATTVSYSGPPGVHYGDKMVKLFLQEVYDSNPVGDALLSARASYISGGISSLNDSDKKTLAQGILLSDPSAQPVKEALSANQMNMMKLGGASNLGLLENAAIRKVNRRRNYIQKLDLLFRGKGPALLQEAKGFVTDPDVEKHIKDAADMLGMEVFYSKRMKRPERHHTDKVNKVGNIASTNEVHHFVHIKPKGVDSVLDGIFTYKILHVHEVNDKVRNIEIIEPN